MIPELMAVQVVPDMRECIAENIPYGRGDEDDGNRGGEVERADNDWHANHVRPLTEVDEHLRPAKRHEDSPDEVDAAE